MAITSIKTGSSFTNLVKYNDFLGPNSAYIPSSYESIASATGTGSAGNITFSSIPSTYVALQLRVLNKYTGTAGTSENFTMQFNSDTTAGNYTRHDIIGNGTTASASGNATSQTAITISVSSATSNTGIPNIMGVAIIDIHDYASTSKYKTVRSFGGVEANTTNSRISLCSGLWLSTSAINSITIIPNTNNWATTSVFSLYGIKGA